MGDTKGPVTREELESLVRSIYETGKVAMRADANAARALKATGEAKSAVDTSAHELRATVDGLKAHAERTAKAQAELMAALLASQRDNTRLLEAQNYRAHQKSMLNLEAERKKAEEVEAEKRWHRFERLYTVSVPIILAAVTLLTGALLHYFWPSSGVPPAVETHVK